MSHFFKAVSLSVVILGSSVMNGSEIETPNKRDQELHDACQAVHDNIQAALDSIHDVKEASAAVQESIKKFSDITAKIDDELVGKINNLTDMKYDTATPQTWGEFLSSFWK